MWKEPDPDPGGQTHSTAQTSRELTELKDQNEQQELMIAQLKEMLRKEQSSVPQEKLEEYINTLSKVKAKRTRIRKDEAGGREKHSSSTVDSNKNERVNLLKQQLEENKAKLAERGLREKGIEEMVTILKAQFSDSQQLIESTPLSTYDKNLEYNKNTGQEELYNILLVKEKKITDFMEKNRKQEATILDLQENLKEKDSVIDARTKAITLMSDSLSKKSKDSLDALDETRDQMRKMQEDFVKLESEMKARQMKLLEDLKSKNIEISELQKCNKQLVETKNMDKREEVHNENLILNLQEKLDQTLLRNKEQVEEIKELQKKLQDSSDDIARLKSAGISMDSVENSDKEVVKLRKQLDESNKNMIKMKAQSKSKVKELTKKIESFKKVSDANATIVQLQNEITKLNEKIAELEEEKGNMQLKMVDSADSIKDESQLEENRAAQEKLAIYLKDLEEKDKIISFLESDIISLKGEINSLNEKIDDFSHLKNVQVTSDIESIQIEEQLDKLESENKKLQKVIKELTSEKHDLIEKFEEVTREKQELNVKLDNYIQENMDLIDKLEKLSAEKVSSAESIEIVEGLTHQEKLELAAYQQTIGGAHSDDSVKCPEDDNGDHPPELNESVLQLNEDSTELLNKIEMFNMERKEVMVKLEALRDENNRLSLKLNEVENNRDILAETYEQLQNEKEELQKENEKLAEKVRQAESVVGVEESNENTFILQELQTKYEKMLNENESLKQTLKDFDSKIHEKDNLETKLAESKVKLEKLEMNIKMNLEEISNYQTIIEDNKVELINSAKIINELQNNLNEKERDIKELSDLMNDLNNVVSDLQKENVKLANFEIMDKQVNELKTALNEQIEVSEAKEQQYKEDIFKTKEFLTDLESRHADMNYQLFETLQELEKRNKEIEILKQNLLEKDEMINALQNQKQAEDKKIGGVIDEMRQKYLRLQTQLDGNKDSLEKKVEELSNKNKEQLEKMKKIAANLKKKSQAYSQLEEKYTEEKEKWEIEINKKESDASDKITSLLAEVEDLTKEVNKKTKHLEESEFKLKELSDIIDNLEQQKADLQNYLLELKHKQDKLSELSLKQELSTSMHEEFDNLHGNNESTYEDKIKELELIKETNESELIHFRERVQKLDEDMSHLLEEKAILEQKSSTLEEKLVLTSKMAEERAQLGEELSNKLSELTANEAVLIKKLEAIEGEYKILNDRSREQEELILKLKVKLKKAHEKVTELKTAQSSMEELENANVELKKQLAHLEALVKHAHEENEEMRNRNQNDYERIESDYQLQLKELVTCKNELTIECEKLQEALKSLREKEEDLLSEIADYKQKLYDVEHEHYTKIHQLTEDLKAANTNWRTALEEIDEVKHQLSVTQKQIVIQTAKGVVEDVVAEATEQVSTINSKETQTETDYRKSVDAVAANEPEILPTFIWPEAQQHDHSHDWLVNVETPQETELLRENMEQRMTVTREDLQSKIKALEVLLYNVDKEKEEILEQCSGMLTELTRLVYEKVNAHNPGASKFYPTSSITAPSDLESQIVSNDDIDASNDKKVLQQIEFEKCFPSSGQQNVAVVEQVLQPKKAYLTYQAGAEAFGENDDGWGWGPEEAKLEEEHLYQAESTPQVQALRVEIGRLNEKLQVFQKERENHLEEIKQLQVKSGKLIKKCRELKQKNDQLSSQKPKKADSDFFDLEQTIQEELKSQITSLEKRIKESHTELEKERTEKTNILKRVDVLSSANEKMVEMKEIQDSEVLRWKRKYEEMEERLRQQKWAIDDNEGTKEKQSAEVETHSQNTEELQQMIKELALDNEELQILLNEQRQQRIEAEKNKNSARTEEEFLKITEEFEEKLRQLQQELSDKSKEFHERFVEKDKIVTELQGELKIKEDVIQSLEENVRYLNESNNELRISLEENISIANQAQDIQFMNQSKQLEEHIAQLEALLAEKTAAAAQLKTSYDQNLISYKTLEEQVEYLTISLENIKQEYNDLQTTSSDAIEKLQNELEAQRQNSSQMNPDEPNPVVQQLTNYTVNTLMDLYEKFCSANADYENLKVLYQKVVDANKSTGDAINELQQELFDSKREFSELQNSSSKSILDLQNELVEQKQKFDQLQTEKSVEIKRLETQLLEQRNNEEMSVPEQLSDDLVQQISNLESLLATKEENINHLQNVVDDLHKQRAILDEDMKQLKNHLNEKQMELDGIVKEMEEKFTNTVAELEKKWEVQVDERGNTVAESWKYHLNMVESEFAVVQEKLKNDIDELEEKCNALVNENNELRKNVDTEIKNEVDRTSAMQQQINDSQKAVKELSERLSEEQIAKVSLGEQLSNLEHEKISLQNSISEKEFELSSLKVIIETTQKQFDEKREVIEEIVKILERNTSWPLSCEKQDVLNELQRQLNTINERDEEISRLNAHISVLQSQANDLCDKDKEIVRLNNLVSDLKSQLEQVKKKNQELLEESQTVEQMQKQLSALQDKEAEIARLNKIIEEYKVQIDKNHDELDILQRDKTEAFNTLQTYKQTFEELKLSNESLQSSTKEKNQQIESLKHLAESLKHAEEEKQRIETEMLQFRNEYYTLQQSLAECQQQLYQATQELGNKAYELENTTQQLAYSQQNTEILDAELNRLRELSDAKETELIKSLEEVKQNRFTDLENHYQEILSSKDIDIQAIKAQLSESVSNAHELSEKFNHELSEKDELQKQLQEKINEQNTLLEEENNQLSEMRGIIEQQVIKIEQLKEELFQKSNDYDSIIAEMDMGRKAITQQPTAQNENPGASSPPRSVPEEDLSEPANRAELDLALYMLHQRDVRCEELLVELALILEERDTLQLRLSNALRENEEIRRKITQDGQMGGVEMILPSSSSGPFTGLSGASSNFSASNPELETEQQDTPSGNQILDNKLSELKRVGYKRDKTFVDEQQLRRYQQMSIMQQHINEASKLPPEAQAKLVDASYTLSRDVQSPSKVLLNWLWGNSTPKENES